MGRATGVSAGISGGFAAGGRRRLRICGPGCLIVTIADGGTLAIHRRVRWTMRASSTAHVGCALALLLGGCSSPERREIPASPEAASAEEASPEDERCATFVDSFSIVLSDGSRYAETHNDVCGGRSCVLDGSGGVVPVACLPAPEPQLGITARRLLGPLFEVRASSEGIAGFSVVEWTPAASRMVLERDLGLAGQVEASVVDGRVALVANCDLEARDCTPLAALEAPDVSRSWWLDASGRLESR